MTDPDLIGLFIRPLEHLELAYMITGGVASVIYGDPRFTRDIDVVLELPTSEIEGHFNLVHRDTALRADVYLRGDDRLHDWAFARRQRIKTERLDVWVAPVEYVILRKLQYYRTSGSDRHLRDVAMMLRISGDVVDSPALEEWSVRLGLESVLEEARGFTP